MKPGILLFIFLVSFSITSIAQTNRTVRGKVYDSSHVALPGATVMLIPDAGKDTLKTLTDKAGQFVFSHVITKKFTLKVTNAGLEDVINGYDVEEGKSDFNAGSITMLPAFQTLQEVVISPPPVVIKEDTIEFRADSFKVKPNSSVEDLLKKLPGLEVDKDGNITAQGKTITKIKVNGKDFFGGDPKTASRELPAEIIDKVQLVDDYGDLAAASGIKDGDPNIVINLQLKKDKNQGVFGRASAGYGTDNRYQGTLNANVFRESTQLSVLGNLNNINQNLFNFGGNAGGGRGGGNSGGGDGGTSDTNADQNGITNNKSIGANFRTDFNNKKGSFYGNYSFASRNTVTSRNTSQENFFGNGSFINNKNSLSDNLNDNHRANLNFEYNFDSLNYLKVSPNFSYGYASNRSNSDFNYWENDIFKTQEGYNGDTVHRKTPNFSGDINYNHRFRKKGRNFSVNIGLGTSTSLSDDDRINFTREFMKAGGYSDAYLDQLITQGNSNHNYGIRATYTEPVSGNRFLDISYAYNNAYAKNNRRTFDRDSIGSDIHFNDSLSNAYENTFVNQRVGLSLRTVNKKYNYSVGLTVQPMEINGYSISKDSVYTPQRRINVAPSARLSYNFSRTRRLNMNYNANYQQPSFDQLQPVRDVSNPQYQTQGNPGLRPAFNHNFRAFFNNFNYTSGRTMFVGMRGNMIHNRIVNNNMRIDSSGAQLSMPENVKGNYSLSGFYNYSQPFRNRKYIVSLNGNINYNHDVGLVDSKKNTGNNWIATQRLNVEFNYKEWLELNFSGAYSLNSTKYTLSQNGERLSSAAWTLRSNMRMDIPGGLILRYDINYLINNGLASAVNGNPTLFNASIEKTIFKKKNGFIRVSGFDIFNQNTNISRQVNGNAIIDSRVNRLTRYFMLTFSYRLMQFKGGQQAPEQNREMGPGRGERRNRQW
ncbi:outer membrane beta-barrel protein [Agriterribacter sp.]|uniref:outer membrane beta-barrel protein n=1 Tax=Agriterribacter sp. TaxID=2821509 RepID=UPI002CDE926F|nr:outer membrane beta-barrel protein [Agriterribacter sp.]HTN05898.1 outer membrane beta-barrel protein [Agriterribacter sp.]